MVSNTNVTNHTTANTPTAYKNLLPKAFVAFFTSSSLLAITALPRSTIPNTINKIGTPIIIALITTLTIPNTGANPADTHLKNTYFFPPYL